MQIDIADRSQVDDAVSKSQKSELSKWPGGTAGYRSAVPYFVFISVSRGPVTNLYAEYAY